MGRVLLARLSGSARAGLGGERTFLYLLMVVEMRRNSQCQHRSNTLIQHSCHAALNRKRLLSGSRVVIWVVRLASI